MWLNGPQCPSSETCTLTWLLLTPGQTGKWKLWIWCCNWCFWLFALPCCRQHTLQLQSFPSCYRGLHWPLFPCTQSSPIQPPFSRKLGQYKDLPSLFLRDGLVLKSRQVPEKHLHLISFYNFMAAEFCSTFKKDGYLTMDYGVQDISKIHQISKWQG